MRLLLGIMLVLLAVQCIAQDGTLQSTHPDLMIVVRKSSTGPDEVEITTLAQNYPKELLAKQIQDLATELKSPLRGLGFAQTNPIPGNQNTSALRATFAVIGLIQRDKSILGLQAIARAFAEGPKPGKPNALVVQYATEAPTKKLLRQDETKALKLEAQADPRFGLEYRIKLNTTNRDDIVIAEGPKEQAKPKVEPPKPQGGTDWLVIGAIVLAALAVGALVYSLLLRPRPKLKT